jgi:branched-chain amino acid transport system permease protein
VKLFSIVVIGGIGTIEGPIVGAFIYVLLSQRLAEYIHVSLYILGVMTITVILVAPRGSWGRYRKNVALRSFHLEGDREGDRIKETTRRE